ncbi:MULTISPECIES: 50S ribosomal protein L25 [unclassified Candidatus Frackibacter]|uniref:50S ribosomal protein L25 n=1 Tax=unclassified Candidatus Frackibacter TaxID=2648818 RepID=UPI000794A6A0|nr:MULTISPECIES: 50S ribosomal protein L25 [unclassified Candidatus Frackibacter]KXS45681.1 MAG: large subunit ribosomal protein L25 [Candidatus Frackibacter sp. T328-2]SDC66370.1 large subunit ribosomal protein L25 [Candidatus Frackibacter sp. WG11]SEM79519.1 large subunit ribosomal protein L25 [Candidatus Frackibacter sp. WG12]SFL90233.1 large subunit ribosomal protein L25 [Candidatus Frackibacter sp. WG13]
MERLELGAEVRTETGSGVARRLRDAGLVPGVVYGRKEEVVNLKLDSGDLKEVINGNAIIDLDVDDEVKTVMVKEVQKDAITGQLLHVDFHQIALDEAISIEVPVTLEGVAAGQREGGVVQQALREIEVECLPTNIPEDVKVDISELEVGESLHVAELETEEDVEIVTSGDEVVVTVVVPTELEVEPDEVEEEEIEEPEVIGEEPDEEEEIEEEEE